MLGSSNNTDRRSVAFSPAVQTNSYEASEGDDSTWFATDDRVRFQQEIIQDTFREGRILKEQSPEEGTQDDVFRCIGLERALSPEKEKGLKKHKRRHGRLVLEAQDACGARELRRISRASSRPSRANARELAAAYWSMSGD